jgi:adenylate cyclase, class 2
MQIEYEIKFLDIDPDTIRTRLQSIGAICTIPLRRMQRYVFAHPTKKNAYIRIRQEGNKATTSYKEHDDNNAIDSVKEIEVTIDNVDAMRSMYIAF